MRDWITTHSSAPAKSGRGRSAAGLLIFTAAALLATPAAAGERQRSTVLMSENEGARKFQEQWGYSDAVVAGDTIYLSGIVVGQRNGETLEAAYERTYGQIGAILKRAGASWDDVVDISSFHTDVEGQIEKMVTVHKRHVKAPYPAWTAIGAGKILGGGITEIKIVAKRPAPRARRGM
ncbi:MAG TPA: Rid family hydrolase [Allosphingosinicella sp.]|nr:Rid family hydrolase [Allosphingosinicella sp.]